MSNGFGFGLGDQARWHPLQRPDASRNALREIVMIVYSG